MPRLVQSLKKNPLPPKMTPSKKRKSRLPDKAGKVLDVRDPAGNLLFQGTEAQWRSWVKVR